MAKHSKRRKFRRYLKGAIDHTLSLGTLNSKVVISTNMGDTVNERTYVSSIRALWSLDNLTGNVSDGPILVGVAHSDYTSTEIEEWLETSNSWNEGDLVQQEVAKRKIRRVGIFNKEDIIPADAVVLNDGKPINTKCGWILLQGQTLKVWAYNLGASNLETTSPNVFVNGHANLWPQ